MSNLTNATFGAGCFWGVENKFMNIKGVEETSVGYMGSKFKNPTYFDVCSGLTGHAEVVMIKFDPEIMIQLLSTDRGPMLEPNTGL